MNQPTNPRRRANKICPELFFRPALLGLALFALAALTGCSALRFTSAPPKAQVDSFQLTNRPTGPVSFQVLQAQVMRFADTYVATVAQACDDSMSKATNTEMRSALLRWKLGQATSAYIDATGANSAVNALDLLVMSTMAGSRPTATTSTCCSKPSANWKPTSGRSPAACSSRSRKRNCGRSSPSGA